MKTLSEVIAEGTPLLLDGALGTELYNRGVFLNRSFDDVTLSNSELLTQIHRDYILAGANAITTNSWGANRYKLKTHELQDQVERINKTAAQIACRVAEDTTYVFGSVGPLGLRLEPWGPTALGDAREAFEEQIAALVAGGVHAISLETFDDLAELEQAILASKNVAPHIPVFAQFMIGIDLRLTAGTPLDQAIQKLHRLPTDVIGLNCSVGPAPMLSAIKIMQQNTDRPLILQPNAGLPRRIEGRSIYLCSPEYMAEFAKLFWNENVQFVGGCCGTGPAHIKSMAQSLRHRLAMLKAENTAARDQQQRKEFITLEASQSAGVSTLKEKVPFAEKSKWSKGIAEGRKVYAVELLPPASVVPKLILEKSRQLKNRGVDVINIPDGPRASARMSALLTAVLIEQQVGIETVLHYTCRDRNLLGMQSDMLGAFAIGLRNLLLVTGDPPKIGAYPDATGVFDVDAIGLTNMVHRLNCGIDLGERSIGEPTAISIGVGANPVHHDIQYELKRFFYKVDAGAEWAITQPVFDIEALYRFFDAIDRQGKKIPIVAGIWPLVSYKNAIFMNNEVPGVVIPQAMIDRMEKAKDPEDAKKVGVELAQAMVEKILPDVAGIQVSAPFGRIDLALDVISK